MSCQRFEGDNVAATRTRKLRHLRDGVKPLSCRIRQQRNTSAEVL